MFADIWGQPVLVYMAAFNAFDGIVINGIISSSKYNLLDPMYVYTDAASTFYTTRAEQPHMPSNQCFIAQPLCSYHVDQYIRRLSFILFVGGPVHGHHRALHFVDEATKLHILGLSSMLCIHT